MILTLLLGLRLLNSSKIFVNKLPNKNIKKYNEKRYVLLYTGIRLFKKLEPGSLKKYKDFTLRKTGPYFSIVL